MRRRSNNKCQIKKSPGQFHKEYLCLLRKPVVNLWLCIKIESNWAFHWGKIEHKNHHIFNQKVIRIHQKVTVIHFPLHNLVASEPCKTFESIKASKDQQQQTEENRQRLFLKGLVASRHFVRPSHRCHVKNFLDFLTNQAKNLNLRLWKTKTTNVLCSLLGRQQQVHCSLSFSWSNPLCDQTIHNWLYDCVFLSKLVWQASQHVGWLVGLSVSFDSWYYFRFYVFFRWRFFVEAKT